MRNKKVGSDDLYDYINYYLLLQLSLFFVSIERPFCHLKGEKFREGQNASIQCFSCVCDLSNVVWSFGSCAHEKIVLGPNREKTLLKLMLCFGRLLC